LVPDRTRETVAGDTSASRATSVIVDRGDRGPTPVRALPMAALHHIADDAA
jgi:hypothetical protein